MNEVLILPYFKLEGSNPIFSALSQNTFSPHFKKTDVSALDAHVGITLGAPV